MGTEGLMASEAVAIAEDGERMPAFIQQCQIVVVLTSCHTVSASRMASSWLISQISPGIVSLAGLNLPL